MHRRRLIALSSALLAGSLAGCLDESTNDPDESPPDTAAPGTPPDIDDEQLRELVAQTNGFTFELYWTLLEGAPDENLFASPISASIALAMAYAGARGETRTQMRETLRYTLGDDDLHAAFEQLQTELDGRGENVEADDDGAGNGDDDGAGNGDEESVPFELSVVNSIWGQTDYPFEQAYLTTLETHYGSGLREVDFRANTSDVRDQINGWVADETNDRIEELLPPNAIDTLTRLVLVNAVYFMANWKHTFRESSTGEATFTALDGTEHDVQLMSQQRSWQYAEVDGARAVDLPYVGGEASMLVVLPPDGKFESYERSFDGETLTTLVDALEPKEGEVRLPRFEFESGFELGGALESMGMTDAFDSKAADFGGIAPPEETGEELFIDGVYHDTYVAVDENGTEAAAATGVVIGDESAPADPFTFVADRPFLFAIRDRPTDSVLFFGRVVDPEGWE